MRVFGIIAGIVITGLIALGGLVHALDVADVVREWTPEGKKLAAERVKLPAHDEMVLIPAGSFIMGSDRKIDRNAYPAEFPQRKVYLDAYEIDTFEVTVVQFLKFILAMDLPPLSVCTTLSSARILPKRGVAVPSSGMYSPTTCSPRTCPVARLWTVIVSPL